MARSEFRKALSYGADKALITIGGTSTVEAVGEDAVGASLADSTLTVAGTLDVEGESLGVQMDATSTLDVEASSAISTNSMMSDGLTTLADQSSLSVSGTEGGSSTLGTISGTNATVNVGAGAYDIASLSGEGNSLRFTDLAHNQGVQVKSLDGSIRAVAAGTSNDQYDDAGAAAAALISALEITGQTKGNVLEVEEGLVNDSLTADITADNKLENVVETKNEKISSFGSVALLSAFQWRHEMSDLTKRMGELRDAPQGTGAWVRLFGSEQSYEDIDATNTSIQVGVDTDVGAGWKVGGAFTYTDGSADFANGDSDNESYGFAVYGTWLAEGGQYVDLAAKYNRLSTDFAISGMDGSIDNNAWSVSAEVGHHLMIAESAFVEPQVQFTYGTVMGDDVTAANGVRLEQDDFTSLVGRVGVRGGLYFPEKKGSVYVRASVLHDFDGEMENHARLGDARNSVKDDLGGTWMEYGVGAHFQWSESTNAFVDLERSTGGDVGTNWRWNVGVRHVF